MPLPFHLLQVCNVGRIIGGTAACAWTVTRALPTAKHSILFFGSVTKETRTAFADAHLEHHQTLALDDVRRLNPDLILLHNTPGTRIPQPLPVPTLQYVHSRIDPAPANHTVYCSQWLARQFPDEAAPVLLQAVPRPVETSGNDARVLRSDLTVGRICTPTSRKWPPEVAPFYGRLANRFPSIAWEFVGCPATLQETLAAACRGRARFFEPSWNIRSRLWQWDVLLYHNPHVTESFGRTAAEAMRAGCIPVIDDRGGFREQLPREAGYLCKTDDDFAHALEKLHDRPHRTRLSRAARAHADEHFSLARFGTDLCDAFERALANATLPANAARTPPAAPLRSTKPARQP